MSSTYAIVTLGCKTNQFESAAMGEQLQRGGYRQVDFSSGADLVVVNTCTVTAATDSQSRNLIRRAKRLNPAARIIVTGCYAQIDPQSLKQIPGVTLVIGNHEKATLLDHIQGQKTAGEIKVADIREQHILEPLTLAGFEQRSRAFVQIQNGCDAFCSYCIIPYARGKSRSVPVPAVVDQVKKLSAAGYPEIVLTGIHIGQYGLDFDPGTNLLMLLQRIETSGFNGRLRLGSIEPKELSNDLLRYIIDSEWICPHFHIPLQAGDDETLKRMNRHYSTDFFAQLLDQIRENLPDAAIGTDIISGFPGESDRQFEKTHRFLEDLPLTHLHVFPFSRRRGTPAETLPGQLAGDVIRERATLLRQVGIRKNSAFAQRFVGSRLELVMEGGGAADKSHKGLSQNYLPVWVDAAHVHQGKRLDVMITEHTQNGLVGNPA